MAKINPYQPYEVELLKVTEESPLIKTFTVAALVERLHDYGLDVPVAVVARWTGGRRLQVWDWVLTMSRFGPHGLRLAPPVYLRKYVVS